MLGTHLETNSGASGSAPASGCGGMPEGSEYRMKDGEPVPNPCT